MTDYLLKQPKATCVLVFIECKINLGLVKNNGNPGGRGGHSDPGNQGGRGGQKTLPSVGGVWIFSGITHYILIIIILYIKAVQRDAKTP